MMGNTMFLAQSFARPFRPEQETEADADGVACARRAIGTDHSNQELRGRDLREIDEQGLVTFLVDNGLYKWDPAEMGWLIGIPLCGGGDAYDSAIDGASSGASRLHRRQTIRQAG